MKIYEILEKLNRKEFILPPFQREFVWNDKEKIVEFVDSLYRGYPIGSVIIWKPTEEDIKEEIKERAIQASVKGEPLYARDYILDGQQRLTTIFRIFHGDPFIFKGEEFILHFDIENEEFCFIRKGEKIKNFVPFHEIMNKTNDQLIEELKIKKTDTDKIIKLTSVFEKIRRIKEKEITVEYSPPLKRESALQLFIRLNTGGKPLETENLALGYISIKWPSVREELEIFREQIYGTNFKFDYDFFVRCLSAISFKQPLKRKMVPEFGKKNVSEDWEKKAKVGIRRLIDFLKGELFLDSDMFIEAQNTLIPLVLIMSQKEVKGKERELLAYSFLLAYINRRYSGAKFVNLDKDIELICKSSNPVEDWANMLEKDKGMITTFKPEDIEETNNTTFQFALFVLLKSMNVKQDLLGRNFLENAASEEDKPEFHHIFPIKCLEGTQYEEMCDHIANLTIITSKSNKEISKKQPDYLLQISDDLKRQHFIPQDKDLYRIDRYEDFLKERQKLIANALNNLLSQKGLKS
jgi:uncharacterized protein with ParB-like and HNH nuclease domain